MLLAGMVGWSRVVCGVHWPIDVLVGAGVGLLSGYLALRLSDQWCVGVRVTAFVSTLLVTAAVLLANHNGGLKHVQFMGHFLSLGGLAYYFACLASHFLPYLRSRKPQGYLWGKRRLLKSV